MQIIFSPTDYLEFEEAPKAKSRQTISSCWQPVAMQSLQLVIDYRTCVTSSARSLLNTERYRFFLCLASWFKKSHNAVLYFTKCWYFLQAIQVHKSIQWLGPSILSAKTQISWAGRIKWGVWTWWKNIPMLIFFFGVQQTFITVATRCFHRDKHSLFWILSQHSSNCSIFLIRASH